MTKVPNVYGQSVRRRSYVFVDSAASSVLLPPSVMFLKFSCRNSYTVVGFVAFGCRQAWIGPRQPFRAPCDVGLPSGGGISSYRYQVVQPSLRPAFARYEPDRYRGATVFNPASLSLIALLFPPAPSGPYAGIKLTDSLSDGHWYIATNVSRNCFVPGSIRSLTLNSGSYSFCRASSSAYGRISLVQPL